VTHQSLGTTRKPKGQAEKTVERDTISCFREKVKSKGRCRRTSTQCDVEDKVLRSKEFVNAAMTGWVICDGFA